MNDHKFTLRELRASDSPALVKLISSFDGDMTTHFLVDAYAALIFGTEHQIAGVGVECAGVDGLVGLGTVRFSEIRFNTITMSLGPRDPLHAVVGAKPAFRPHIEITVAVQGPAPIDRQGLLFGYGRL